MNINKDEFAEFVSELSKDQKTFTITIKSSISMHWHEVLLALATWLADESKLLKPRTKKDIVN